MAEATENFHELVFEHAPVGLVLTENRVIRSCNPMFAEMFGYAVSELVDRSFAILYPSIEEFVRVAALLLHGDCAMAARHRRQLH